VLRIASDRPMVKSARDPVRIRKVFVKMKKSGTIARFSHLPTGSKGG
jgi:hypothetical protein